jgi:hypothetical protein
MCNTKLPIGKKLIAHQLESEKMTDRENYCARLCAAGSGFLTCICFPPDFLYFPEATIR